MYQMFVIVFACHIKALSMDIMRICITQNWDGDSVCGQGIRKEILRWDELGMRTILIGMGCEWDKLVSGQGI